MRWPGDPRDIIPTVTTISLTVSVVIYAGCFFGAPAYASAMGAPAATTVIRLLAILVLSDGFTNTPAAILQRNFRQGQRTIADQVNLWLGTGVTVALDRQRIRRPRQGAACTRAHRASSRRASSQVSAPARGARPSAGHGSRQSSCTGHAHDLARPQGHPLVPGRGEVQSVGAPRPGVAQSTRLQWWGRRWPAGAC